MIKQQIWKHTADGKIIFSPLFFNGCLLEAGILLRIMSKKSPFLVSKSRGGCLLEHNGRIFEILQYVLLVLYIYMYIYI